MAAVLTLDQPVTTLTGVGPQYGDRLERLGIRSLRDLLLYLPFRHEDYSRLTPIGSLRTGVETTVRGYLAGVRLGRSQRGKEYVSATVSDGTGAVTVYWFNQPWLLKRLTRIPEIFLAGKPERQYRNTVMMNPIFEPVTDDPRQATRILPIYHETEGLTSRWLRGKIELVLPLADEIEEFLPDDLLARRSLPGRAQAVRQMHAPDSARALEAARHRINFEQAFLLQLAGQLARRTRQSQPAHPVPFDAAAARGFVAALPFALTTAQRKAAWQILQDMQRPAPMNRLLEGDVGSGKTVVAAMAMHHAARAGFQAVLLAPTEILARQHADVVEGVLRPFGVGVGMLLGSTPGKQREPLLDALRAGEVSVAVGTHALLEEGVQFHNLALVVVDEQHRFGVRQRTALAGRGGQLPHFLSMSATPIPRTLARTLFADLDISVLDEMPPGRPPVETRLVPPEERPGAYRFIRDQISTGRQVFVICPLIQESDKLGVRSATAEVTKLQREIFPDLAGRIALLHGRLKPAERESVMASFQRGETAILVATSVVEVGIDIPNATVMMVEDAERFGLAQLHQFRGRIGRGSHASYCLLFTENDEPRTLERLHAVVALRSGFDLAEVDRNLRGMGDLYGVTQHGHQFSIENLLNTELIGDAQVEAARLVDRDPALAGSPGLRRELAEYSQVQLVGD